MRPYEELCAQRREIEALEKQAQRFATEYPLTYSDAKRILREHKTWDAAAAHVKRCLANGWMP